jgi:hypothetical protein
VHVPQLTTVQPAVTAVLPQLEPIGQTGHMVLTHCPVALHVSGAVHIPQLTMPPQPSDANPHVALPQAWAWASGVHTQVPGPVVELHEVWGAVHVPQLATVQPGVTAVLPQLSPIGQTGHIVLTHCPAALHVSGALHVPHVTVPPQPSAAVPHVLLPQA